MKCSLRRLLITFIVIVFTLSPLSSFVRKIYAASLTDVTITPGNTAVSQSTNDVVTFTPVTAITNSSIIEVSYDTAFTGGATLTNTDIAISGTNITSKTCSGFIAGYFTCTLTTSANVTTLITMTVGGTNKLTTPSSIGNYNWSITVNIGGTGTTYDTGAGLAYIANDNQVLIKATVPSTLAMDLYNSGTTVLMTAPNTCNFGVLSPNKVNTCAYDVGVGTNDTAGATVKIQAGGQLTNGSYSMTQASGSAIVAGTEKYGFYISTAGSKFTASGSYATQHQAVPTSVTTFATSTTTSDKATLGDHFTVTHAATMSTNTPTGNYTQTVSYFAFTK